MPDVWLGCAWDQMRSGDTKSTVLTKPSLPQDNMVLGAQNNKRAVQANISFVHSVETTTGRFDSSICDATSGGRSAAAKDYFYENSRAARAEPESKWQ